MISDAKLMKYKN